MFKSLLLPAFFGAAMAAPLPAQQPAVVIHTLVVPVHARFGIALAAERSLLRSSFEAAFEQAFATSEALATHEVKVASVAFNSDKDTGYASPRR